MKNLEDKLGSISVENSMLKVGVFTVFYSEENLGTTKEEQEGKYFDILGEDGVEIEYANAEEVLIFLAESLSKNLQDCYVQVFDNLGAEFFSLPTDANLRIWKVPEDKIKKQKISVVDTILNGNQQAIDTYKELQKVIKPLSELGLTISEAEKLLRDKKIIGR